jgi:hypothetical protein
MDAHVNMKNPFVIGLLALAGCTAIIDDPWYTDTIANPDRIKLENETEKLKINYLARYLMEGDDRDELTAEVSQSEIVQRWGALEYSTASSMATDAVVGDLGSPLGRDIGGTVLVAGMVLGEIFDGSMDNVSQAWLPEEIDGQTLDTAEAANDFLVKHTYQKAKALAEKLAWSFECVFNCDGMNQIFLISRPKTDNTQRQYIYVPEHIVVVTNIVPVEPVKPDDPISALLNLPVKWRTPVGDSYRFHLYADPIFNDDGSMKVLTNEETGISYPAVNRRVITTHLGRDILRFVHDTELTLMGTADTHPKLIFHNGKIYSYITNGNTRMVKWAIEEPMYLN